MNVLTTEGVSSAPASSAVIDLCSAPWYSYTRRRSGTRPSVAMYPIIMAMRMTPSMALSPSPPPEPGSHPASTPGTTKNSASISTTPTTVNARSMNPGLDAATSGPPSSDCSAAHSMAFTPRRMDSTSPITPRTTGTDRHRVPHVGTGPVFDTISPDGVRTATAHVDAPRISTPPKTACPPYARKASSPDPHHQYRLRRSGPADMGHAGPAVGFRTAGFATRRGRSR